MDYKETAKELVNGMGSECEIEHTDLKDDLVEEIEKYKVENISQDMSDKLHRKLSLSSVQAKLLSEIQVNVGVEVGTLCLNVEDLIDILPGKTFQFSFDEQKLLTLKLGEEEIAKARFVQEKGSLALEIISVMSK